MIVYKTTKQPDGTYATERLEVPDEEYVGDELYERAKAMAEANPGKIVCGWQSHEGAVEKSIGVDLLENL